MSSALRMQWCIPRLRVHRKRRKPHKQAYYTHFCQCHRIRRIPFRQNDAVNSHATTGDDSASDAGQNSTEIAPGAAIAAASLSRAIASASVAATGLSFLDATLGAPLASVLCSVSLSVFGYIRRSLQASGAFAAFVVSLLSWLSYLSFASTLLAFYTAGSTVTAAGQQQKEEQHDQTAGNAEAELQSVHAGRTWKQVLAVAAIPTAIGIAHASVTAGAPPLVLDHSHSLVARLLAASYVGAIGCAAGDTFASEVGMLDSKPPRFVLNPLRKVEPGTNGGVSLLGTVGSAVGGCFIGCVFASCTSSVPLRASHATYLSNAGFALSTTELIACSALGTFAAVTGSFLDSLLGATLQYSGWSNELQKVVHRPAASSRRICGKEVLSNTQVNFVSSVATALVTALLAFCYIKL